MLELAADLAYLNKWQPSELDAMTRTELLTWHALAMRIVKAARQE